MKVEFLIIMLYNMVFHNVLLTRLGYVVSLCKGIDYAIHLSGINNYLRSLGAPQIVYSILSLIGHES